MSRLLPGNSAHATAGTKIMGQRGVIVHWRGQHGTGEVYSPTCGRAVLPRVCLLDGPLGPGDYFDYRGVVGCESDEPTRVWEWVGIGAFVTYDCVLGIDGIWVATKLGYVGKPLETATYDDGDSRLQLRLQAVVCSINPYGYTPHMWLWNDLVGRVYVPALYFYVAKPGTVVSCTIAYTPEEGWRHGGEDIPWTVVDSIELIDDKAEMATALSAYGSGLKTAGKTTNLKVTSVPAGADLGMLSDGKTAIHFGIHDLCGGYPNHGANPTSLEVPSTRYSATYVEQIGSGKKFNRAVVVVPVIPVVRHPAPAPSV